MADYEDKDEVKIEAEPEDSDFAEGYGKSATSVIQQLLCNQKVTGTTQRHQNFLLKVFDQEQGM